MYITSLTIQNIRSIESLEIALDDNECAGWHVILGANGAGKSSVIRSIALALIGPKEAVALRQDWDVWLRRKSSEASIRLTIRPDQEDLAKNTAVTPGSDIKVGLRFIGGTGFEQDDLESVSLSSSSNVALEKSAETDPVAGSSIWSASPAGWFAASFGPFRRFSGGDREFERLYRSNPRLAPHLTAFGEDVALTEGLRWLQKLHVLSLESTSGADKLLQILTEFLNRSDLLPHGARLSKVRSERVEVTDAAGVRISIEQMSDGYRSILSMIFEILRQMTEIYGVDDVIKNIDADSGRVNLPGVICIDEVDAHLHPSWQRDVGPWFTRCFPRLQFFVTTHSPIVCRNATSVWRLPEPGSFEEPRRVAGSALQRLIHGSILDAYGTGFFGDDVAISEDSQEKLDELATLNRKALRVRLSPEEDKRLNTLRGALPTLASDTAVE